MHFIDRRLTILLASASLLAACATAPAVETPVAPPAPVEAVAPSPAEPAPLPSLVGEVSLPHETFKLDNGLTVLVHEDHKAPVVGVMR